MRKSKRCNATMIQQIPRLIVRTCDQPRSTDEAPHDTHTDAYGPWTKEDPRG